MDDATAQTDAAAEATASRDAVTVTPSESNRSHSGESAPGDVGEGAAAAKADGSALEKDVKKRPASDIEDDVADEPVAKRAAGPKVGAARGRAKDEEKGETAGTAGGEDEEPAADASSVAASNGDASTAVDGAAGDEATVNKQGFREGKWTEEEHELFLSGMHIFGRSWTKIAKNVVKTRSIAQVRSHAQKYERRLRNEREKMENQLKQEQWYRSSQEHIREARLQNYLQTHAAPVYHHDGGQGMPARGSMRDMYPGAERGMYSAEGEASHFYAGYGHSGVRHGMPHYVPPPQQHHGMYPPYGHHGGMYSPHQHSNLPPQQLGPDGGGALAQENPEISSSSVMLTGGTSGTAADATSANGIAFSTGLSGPVSNVSGSRNSSTEAVGASMPPFLGGGGHYSMLGRAGPVGGMGPGYRMPAGPVGGYNGMYTTPSGVTGLPTGSNGNSGGPGSFTRPELLLMQQQQLGRGMGMGMNGGSGYPYSGNGMSMLASVPPPSEEAAASNTASATSSAAVATSDTSSAVPLPTSA